MQAGGVREGPNGCTLSGHPLKGLDPALTPLPTAPPHLLEVSHVAHRLSMSEDYVYRLIHDGKLAAIRLGKRWRVDAADLQAFIAKQRRAAVS